jgi:hypothetical protein
VTMLEDELREMFSARVSAPPAALDPAGVAIKHGRRSSRRRRVTMGAIALVAFAALLGSAAMIKGFFTPIPGLGGAITYDGLYGTHQPNRGEPANPLPTMTMPIDLHVGTSLFTSDGRKLTLSGVDEVTEIIRVPAGWLYSDDFRLRLLTNDNNSMLVRDNISRWLVSLDGSKVATVAEGKVVQVSRPDGQGSVKTVVPGGVELSGFYGPRLVLGSEKLGSAYWNGAANGSLSGWNDHILAFFGALNDGPMALVRDGDAVCLADLVAIENSGWAIGDRIGCGELLEAASRAVGGLSTPTRSPDGRWLAVPSWAGVHLIDLNQDRTQLDSAQAADPVISQTCVSSPNAPAIWASPTTVVTVAPDSSLLACGVDGARHVVQLPLGVTTGWALIPRFGLPA